MKVSFRPSSYHFGPVWSQSEEMITISDYFAWCSDFYQALNITYSVTLTLLVISPRAGAGLAQSIWRLLAVSISQMEISLL